VHTSVTDDNASHCFLCVIITQCLTLQQITNSCFMQHHSEDRKRQYQLEMWANAQRDGRPAEYRWRPLFNAAVWLTPTTRVPCSNAAKTRNPLKLPGVPQTNKTISAASGPKFTILWGHVGEILLLNKFFFRLSIHALVAKI